MARVTAVVKARKSPGQCGTCGKKIEVGESYFHWQPYFRAPRSAIRCIEHAPKSWETESNEKRASLMRAESLVDAVILADSLEDAIGLLEDAIGLVEGVVDGLRDSAQNMTEYFVNSERAEVMATHADELDSWVTSAQDIANELANDESEDDFDMDEPSWHSIVEGLDVIPNGEW